VRYRDSPMNETKCPTCGSTRLYVVILKAHGSNPVVDGGTQGLRCESCGCTFMWRAGMLAAVQ
jgi:hypothetical protein